MTGCIAQPASQEVLPYYYWCTDEGTCSGALQTWPPDTYLYIYLYNEPSLTIDGKNAGNLDSCGCHEGSSGSGDSATGNGASGGSAAFVGDPINASTGNSYVQQDDYPDGGWLTLRRFYNGSAPSGATAMGSHWRQSFDRSLEITGSPATSIIVFRPDGFQETFTKTNGVWTSDPDITDTLTEADNSSGVAISYTVFIAGMRHYETYSTSGLLQTVTDETGQGITLTYSSASTPSSVAPIAGLLLTVTDPKGRQLNFSYNSNSTNGNNNISQVTLPDGGKLQYTYNTDTSTGSITLSAVQYPDGKSRQYVYNESSLTGGASLPDALTGIIDEAGKRYESTTYNYGQATSSYLAGNLNTTQVTYNSDGSASVTYPLGFTSTMTFSTVQGVSKLASVSQPCGPQCGQPWQSVTYDANGNPQTSIDFNGNTTATTYNSVGLLTQQIDAQGQAAQRTTSTTWNTTLRVPLQTTVANASGATLANTEWVYNTSGQPLARCQIDPTNVAAVGYVCSNTGMVPSGVRRWTYTYCTNVTTNCPIVGLRLSATGPRTDLTQAQTTSYSYYMSSSATGCGTPGAACYQAGDLQSITDPLGHVTTIASYDGDGRITRITDANLINTDLTYTPRGWLASRTVDGSVTTLGYTAYGAVNSITDPDGVVTTFTYDTAHRLTDIWDAQGNDFHYSLDAAGNKTGEQIFTAANTTVPVQSQSRTYNTLGQLIAEIDGLNQTVFSASYSDSYDANGNLTHSKDGRSYQSYQSFDALNRLSSTIANFGGTDPSTNNTNTTINSDALDRVASVTDPTNLTTAYTYDGLNDRTQLQSPDTGTSTDTYDAAGNRLMHTDAKGNISNSTYDALNRLASTSYADTTLNVTYTYDEANTVTGCTSSNPIGHLTRMIEGAFSTVYCYDGRGNVIQKMYETSTQTDTTLYSYTPADRLHGYTTPDYVNISSPHRDRVSYLYDTTGRVSSVQVVTADAATPPNSTLSPATVVSNVTWLPFGPISSYTLGNGQTITRAYDANYRLTDLTSPAFNLHFARDAMGDITATGNAPGANPALETYSYDPLYRLNGVIESNGSTLENYTYDRTGDRLSKTTSGVAGGAYGYTTGTHQLASIGNAAQANDANGNTTGSVIGGNTYGFGYNDRNRLTVAQLNGQTVGTYTYNALEERINKVATFPSAVSERYAYNETGQLIGEYGTNDRDYIWLGDLPVGVVDNTTKNGSWISTINYVTTDQLGTPRAVSNSAGSVIWQWAYQGNPWGEQQPTSSTGYVFNLRYPGQYFDAETGTNYNLNRNYEQATGRYLQSDPLGMFAGQSSTYAYADSSPLNFIDPSGTQAYASPYRTIGASTIICDGNGQIVAFLADTDPCTKDCTAAHEEVHRQDAMMSNSSACYDQPYGMQVRLGDQITTDKSETRAYEKELDCLRKKLAALKDCDKCRQAIEKEIKTVETQVINYGYRAAHPTNGW